MSHPQPQEHQPLQQQQQQQQHQQDAPPTPIAPSSTATLGSVLQQGVSLSPGQALNETSRVSGRKLSLVYQEDGNLVLYRGSAEVLWHAPTHRAEAGTATVQPDGSFAVMTPSHHVAWHTQTQNKGTPPHRLVLQPDENVILYDATDTPIWSTNTAVRGPPTEREMAEWHRDKAVIVAHSHNLILALRTNALFSSRQRFVEVGKEGSHKLMTYVKNLRRELLTQNRPIPAHKILQPFIEVSKSEETTGPITGVALSALSTFLELKLGFIDVPTITMIATAALEVKSEVTDVQSHEAVLGRILQVLKGCVCHPLGVQLPEEMVLRVVQGCFAIATHGSPSELLRHTADATTTDMVSHLFSCVVNGSAPHCFANLFRFVVSMISTEVDTLGSLLGGSGGQQDPDGQSVKTQIAATKFAGLSLVYVIIATLRDCVTEERCRPLLHIVQDQLCRALLNVSSTVDNVVVIAQMLRTLQLTAMSCGDHMGPQLLAFLLGTYLKDDADAESAERREVILESLMEFCSVDAFPVFIVEAYDHDLHSPSVFESLCKHLTSQCYPTTLPETNSKRLTSLNLCACNALLQLIRSVESRCSGPPIVPTPEMEELTKRKAVLLQFSKLFAEKPKKAIEYAKKAEVDPASGVNMLGITPNCDGYAIGQMLFEYKALLDKQWLGEYISEAGLDPGYDLHKQGDETKEEFDARMAVDADKLPGRVPYCLKVREGFCGGFNFRGVTLTTAMRLYLSAYLLPGEAQRIDRMMEEFAIRWHDHNTNADGSKDPMINPFCDKDSAFVFAFAMIMLNTDLHSQQVETKMTLNEFKKNTRGTNGGKDVNPEYQEMVYNDIKSSEIKMKDAVVDIASEDFQWSQAVQKSRENGGKVGPITSVVARDFDSYLFTVLVDPAISALSAVTEAIGEDVRSISLAGLAQQPAGGDFIISEAMQGFCRLASMSSHFCMTGVTDKLVIALCKFTDVLQPKYGTRAVRSLGGSSKGLFAIREVFRVVHDHGNCMRDSWVEVMGLVLRIYLLGCLPEQASPPGSFPNYTPVSAVPPSQSTVSVASTAGSNSPKEIPQTPSFYEVPVSPIMSLKPMDRIVTNDEVERASVNWFGFGGNEEQKRVQAQTRAAVSRVCKVVSDCSISHLLEGRVRDFSDDVLLNIVIALIKVSGVEPRQGTDGGLATAHPSSIHATVFSVHLLADLLVSNGHRYPVAAQLVENFFTRLLLTADQYISSGGKQAKQETMYWISIGEHVVVSKLRVFVRLSIGESRSLERTQRLLDSLTTFNNLRPDLFGPLVARHVAAAFSIVMQTDALEGVTSPERWMLLISLTHKCGLLARNADSTSACLKVLQQIATCSAFSWPDNVPALVTALVHLYLLLATGSEDTDWEHVTRPGAGVAEGLAPVHPISTQGASGEVPPRVVDTLTSIRNTLIDCSLKNPSTKWVAAWLSVLTGLANIVAVNTKQQQQPGTPNGAEDSIPRERSDALIALQRSLLAPEIAHLPISICYDAMTKVLVPLVQRLCDTAEHSEARQEHSSAPGFFGRFSPALAINSAFGDQQQASPHPAEHSNARPIVKQALTGIEDLQTRVLALLCRAFLHFTENGRIASHKGEFMNLWNILLGLLYAYQSRPPQSGRPESEAVREAVCEQTKNMLNVLASLSSPDLAAIPDFWIVTRQLISPFADLASTINEHLDALGLPGGPSCPVQQ